MLLCFTRVYAHFIQTVDKLGTSALGGISHPHCEVSRVTGVLEIGLW